MEINNQPEQLGFSSNRLSRIQPIMDSYIEERKTGAILSLIERKGEIVHASKAGFMDLETREPVSFDSLFRIYSMTKPIVSLGLMMLLEQAKFQLHDPIARYLPEFGDVKVWGENGKLVEPNQVPTIAHFLTHTTGLSYGFTDNPELDNLYAEADLHEKGIDLAEMTRRIASLPLAFQPGTKWEYSVSTDVIGRLIEVLSGQALDLYMKEKVFDPLGMQDTFFSVPDEKLERLTMCYESSMKGLKIYDTVKDSVFHNVTAFRGGGGLVSTLSDFLQFCRLVRGKGALGDVRLVSRKTIELMCQNHLAPTLLPMEAWKEFPGFGFGLGFSVTMDVAQTGIPGSIGNLGWTGMANTAFWIDPQEDLIGIMFSQLVSDHPFRYEYDFRTLAYQAMVD